MSSVSDIDPTVTKRARVDDTLLHCINSVGSFLMKASSDEERMHILQSALHEQPALHTAEGKQKLCIDLIENGDHLLAEYLLTNFPETRDIDSFNDWRNWDGACSAFYDWQVLALLNKYRTKPITPAILHSILCECFDFKRERAFGSNSVYIEINSDCFTYLITTFRAELLQTKASWMAALVGHFTSSRTRLTEKDVVCFRTFIELIKELPEKLSTLSDMFYDFTVHSRARVQLLEFCLSETFFSLFVEHTERRNKDSIIERVLAKILFDTSMCESNVEALQLIFNHLKESGASTQYMRERLVLSGTLFQFDINQMAGFDWHRVQLWKLFQRQILELFDGVDANAMQAEITSIQQRYHRHPHNFMLAITYFLRMAKEWFAIKSEEIIDASDLPCAVVNSLVLAY